MSALSEWLSGYVLGPDDKLILLWPGATQHDFENVTEAMRQLALEGRVVVFAAEDMQAIPIRATKAEGSTVGQCGDRPPPILGPPPICHLAHGHTGWHSDGEASWTGPSATQAHETTPDDTPAREGT